MSENNHFERLSKIDVGQWIEKKAGLSYLSWAHAVRLLLTEDPNAEWEYREVNGSPLCMIGDTALVYCTVTMFGKKRTAQLPVMDHRNKAITNPDAMQLNTAMQRALVKAIALHGIGLYIYAGEDLPTQDQPKAPDNIDPETGEVLEQLPTMDDVIPIIKGSGITGAMLQRRYGSVANCDLEELREIVKQIKSGASPLEAMGLAEEAAPPTYAQIATKLRKADGVSMIAAALKEAKHLPQQQQAELDALAQTRTRELISMQDVEQ